MRFTEWVEWWNRNYEISVADRMMYVDFSVLQNLDGSKEFLKFITNSNKEIK